jgi:hypothetical protein
MIASMMSATHSAVPFSYLRPTKPVGPERAEQVEQRLVEFLFSGKMSSVPPMRLLYSNILLSSPCAESDTDLPNFFSLAELSRSFNWY